MQLKFLIYPVWLLLVSWLFSCAPSRGTISKNEVEPILQQMAAYHLLESHTWSNPLQDIFEKAFQSESSRLVIEEACLSFLSGDASVDSKNIILYKLGPVATTKSVPVIMDLLAQEGHFDAALYALSFINDDEIDHKLYPLVTTLDTGKAVAVINTLGHRRNPEMVKGLRQLIDSESKLTPSVLAALGNIPTRESAQVLSETMTNSESSLKWLAADHLIQVANELVKQDVDVEPYYRQVFDSSPPVTLLCASLKGMITVGIDPLSELKSIFETGEEKKIASVIPLIRSLNQPPAEEFIQTSFSTLKNENKAQLLIAFGDRGDQRLKARAIEATTDTDSFYRAAGLRTLYTLGGQEDVKLISELAGSLKGEEKGLARKCLYLWEGREVDQEILKLLKNYSDISNPAMEELILAIGPRKIENAGQELIRFMSFDNRNVRLAALKTLGIAGTPSMLPELLHKTALLQSTSEKSEFVKTITNLSLRIDDIEKQTQAISEAFDRISNEDEQVLLVEILGNVANEEAYNIVTRLTKDGSDKIKLSAIKVLGEWPTAKPLKHMIDIFNSESDQKAHYLALIGIERLVQKADSLGPDDKAKLLMDVFNACKTTQERKIVLSGMGKTGSLITFEAAIELIPSDELGSEAEAAILQNIRNIDRDDFNDKIEAYLRSAREKSSSEYFISEIDTWLSNSN